MSDLEFCLTDAEEALLRKVWTHSRSGWRLGNVDPETADALESRGLARVLGSGYLAISSTGAVVASLLLRVDALESRSAGDRDPILGYENGWNAGYVHRFKESAHPAQYVPEDPTWIPNVLAENCPKGYEWTGTPGGLWYGPEEVADNWPGRFGMIRPATRPDLVLTIPAGIADEADILDPSIVASPLLAELLRIIQAARERGTKHG